MDITFLSLVAGNRKRCEIEDMKNLWILQFADLPLSRLDREIHGLGIQLTVSWFSLQIVR